jgi:hypothetical protein
MRAGAGKVQPVMDAICYDDATKFLREFRLRVGGTAKESKFKSDFAKRKAEEEEEKKNKKRDGEKKKDSEKK